MVVTKICPICGSKFSVSPSRGKYNRGKYCSVACKNIAIRKGRNQVECTCAVCGKKFIRCKSHVKSEYQFCSRECMYRGKSLGIIKHVVTKRYDCRRKSPRICKICGKEFIYNSSTQKYCSRTCFEEAHRENMRGDNNPSWLDGRSYSRRYFRGLDWEMIRLRIYKRDKYICQICGVKCVSRRDITSETSTCLIQCHHIKNFETEMDNDERNLITVCARCHGKLHNGTGTLLIAAEHENFNSVNIDSNLEYCEIVYARGKEEGNGRLLNDVDIEKVNF